MDDDDLLPPTPPPAQPEPEDNADSDSDLSDLDDELFKDLNEDHFIDQVPIDESTLGSLGKFKKPQRDGDAGAKKEKRRRRERRREEEEVEVPVPEIELSAEEKIRRELDRKMDEALKGPKKKKRRKNDHDLERMDDETVENLKLAMLEAAKADTEAVENRQPATHKLSMVDEVRELLNRQNLLSVAVDCGILKGIRRWLEPLPNKTLPAYNVQKLMFEILVKLRPDTIHLQESGIGKIVMFYTKDARPERTIKRVAEKLVRDWSRPILGRSDDYRSRAVPVADGSQSVAPSRPRKNSLDDSRNPLAAPVRNPGRARVMLPSSQSYDVAPVSRVHDRGSALVKPINARGEEFIRKMKAKKLKKGTGRG